jgi:hypothetical protein
MKFYETATYKKLKNKEKNNFPNKIIVHHCGGSDADPFLDTSHHTANMMESWHLSKGWEGLGYTFVIHKDGQVWRGRPEHRSGAHTIGQNSSSIGICLSGNFDATTPTIEQEESFKELYKYIAENNGNLPIHEHRDFAKKTCPGNNIEKGYFAKLAEKAISNTEEILDNDPKASVLIEKEANEPSASVEYFKPTVVKYEANMSLLKSKTEPSLPQKAFEYLVYSSKDPNKIGATGKAIGALLATYFITPLSEVFPQLANLDIVSGVQTALFYFGVAYGVFGILRKGYVELKSYLDKKKGELSILQ